jgi:hypothetical protein
MMIYRSKVNTIINSSLRCSNNLQLKGLVEMLAKLFDETT